MPRPAPQEPVVPGAEEPLRLRQLRRTDLPIDTVALARFLIGKIVVRELPSGRLTGRIVETEGYPPGDPAGHHYRGETPRNKTMFLHRGLAYVYFTYGNHFMLNVSSEGHGTGGGVLIRALEPLEGVEQMQHNRGTKVFLDLTRGPGRLAQALQIDRSLDGIDLCAPAKRGAIWLADLAGKNHRESRLGKIGRKEGYSARRVTVVIGKSRRIGISQAVRRILRFYERGNPFVSGPKHLNSPSRRR